jgi:hypothetical protein
VQSSSIPVDDGRTRLVVFLFRDPHLLEGGEGSQDRPSDPDGVFTFRRSHNFNLLLDPNLRDYLHGRRGEGRDFFLHPVGDTGVHGGTTGLLLMSFVSKYHDDIPVEVFADIDITFHNRVVCGLMDTSRFQAEDRGLKESLWSTETKSITFNAEIPFIANGDDLTIRKFVALLEARALCCSLDFLLKVEGDIAQFLLDVTDDFPFRSGGEAVTTFSQDLHEVISQITPSKINTENGMGQSITSR